MARALETDGPLSAQALSEFGAVQDRSGVLYLSSIPPGMAPADVRAHFAPFGDLGRLYLAPDPRTAGGKDGRKKRKSPLERDYRLRTRFVEGWIEFREKRNARTAALALNGQPVASSNPRHRDALWTVKYLPGFKWIRLTEALEYDRAVRDKQARLERRQARRENEHYLAQVDKAQGQARRQKKQTKAPSSHSDAVDDQPKTNFEELKVRFRQRKPINS